MSTLEEQKAKLLEELHETFDSTYKGKIWPKVNQIQNLREKAALNTYEQIKNQRLVKIAKNGKTKYMTLKIAIGHYSDNEKVAFILGLLQFPGRDPERSEYGKSDYFNLFPPSEKCKGKLALSLYSMDRIVDCYIHTANDLAKTLS